MSRILIQGIKQYDGEYELDQDRALNAREWRWIKKISGYLPRTIEEGFAGRDPDLFVALAVIAMCRDGKIVRDDGLRVAEQLSEVPFDNGTTTAITLLGDEEPAEEDDAIPPALTSEHDGSSPKSSLEKPNSTGPNQSLSGKPSETGSGISAETPPATGQSSSPTSSGESVPVRLAS